MPSVKIFFLIKKSFSRTNHVTYIFPNLSFNNPLQKYTHTKRNTYTLDSVIVITIFQEYVLYYDTRIECLY